MKFKIYHQENGKIKVTILDTQQSSKFPNNIIKIKEIKNFKDYLNFSYSSYTDVVNLFKEMSIILNTNLNISQCIDILLEGDNHPNINEVLLTIKIALNNAQPINKALHKHRKFLGNLPILFFQLANTNGDLKNTINALSIILIENQTAKKKFVDAFTYPFILLGSLFISIGIIFNFVLPKFEHIFLQFGDKLPFATKSLLMIKDFISTYYATLFLIFIVLIVGIQYIYKKYKVNFDKIIVLYIPLISNLYKQFIFYRFFLSLSMILKSNYTFQTALENTKHIVNNQFILFKINQVINDINNGTTISTAFKNTNLLDNLTLRLLNTAQETNTLPIVLENITTIHKEKLNESIKYFSSAISPIFILIIGMIILWVVFAIMLPIWSLGSVLN